MPSTIPYDPSLVLGNIVEKEKLDNIVKIGELQAPADAAQTDLNSLITLKRSIDMSVQEMIDMGIDVTALQAESREIGKQVQKAAEVYGAARVAWDLIRKGNYLLGAYHFYCSGDKPAEQAGFFWKVISAKGATDIAPMVDVEQGSLPAKSVERRRLYPLAKEKRPLH